MATKKAEAKTVAAKVTQTNPVASQPALGRAPDQPVGGIAAAELEVLSGDIDSRMAALLKDHKAMGVRK